ncbi:loganic acid O-methyltransferase-like [Tripterygium wilfordii]|uniref:loganic acid O-methyltransferase-like n=1 Tax=Tripterygium wilfordii TaxID=458696 RepID=UPI0018F85710|nr:loganic acid O-methyltransferase-like [Tripterygium wilfordii]
MAMKTTMNGGDGHYSYTRNSLGQRQGLELMKDLINKGIDEKLDVAKFMSSSSSFSPKMFRVADLGSSVGPNTYFAVQNIINSVKLKYQETDVEFQAFFNDQISNDFNTLFKNLPSDREYFVAAAPGPFHGRLFPKKSIHFVHSSYSLHWLSSVPKELVDKESPAYNKGKIFYTSASEQVFEAYTAQFAKDITSFLNARAHEVVHGGLMALLIPCFPDGTPPSQRNMEGVFDLLGDSLTDLANMGLVSEAKVDSFNLPLYHTSPQELKGLIEKNGDFSIERMENICRSRTQVDASFIKSMILHLRAAWEGMIREHFGNDIVDELFDRFTKKAINSSIFSESEKYESLSELFVLLKRNGD